MTALRRAVFQAVREPQGAGRRDLANVQFLPGYAAWEIQPVISVKRESRCRPTKNRFADRTPLLLRGYFTDNNARFLSGPILKRKVRVTISTFTATTRLRGIPSLAAAPA